MSGVKIRENLSAESLRDDDPFTFQYDVTVDGEVMSGGPVRLDRRRQEPHVTRESVSEHGRETGTPGQLGRQRGASGTGDRDQSFTAGKLGC